MIQIKKTILTLALLMTAATGAWADWTGGTYTATTNEELGAITVGADATLTINEGVTVTVKGGINANGHTLTVNGAGTLTVTGTVVDKTPSRSKPEIGSVRTQTIVTNQDDVPVMTFTSIVLIRRKPDASA
jgi:acyl dehydratase